MLFASFKNKKKQLFSDQVGITGAGAGASLNAPTRKVSKTVTSVNFIIMSQRDNKTTSVLETLLVGVFMDLHKSVFQTTVSL